MLSLHGFSIFSIHTRSWALQVSKGLLLLRSMYVFLPIRWSRSSWQMSYSIHWCLGSYIGVWGSVMDLDTSLHSVCSISVFTTTSFCVYVHAGHSAPLHRFFRSFERSFAENIVMLYVNFLADSLSMLSPGVGGLFYGNRWEEVVSRYMQETNSLASCSIPWVFWVFFPFPFPFGFSVPVRTLSMAWIRGLSPFSLSEELTRLRS